MAKRISCEYNIDTACVEIKYDNGVTVSIDCITVENTIPRNMYERSELDYLVYNDPAAYADLIDYRFLFSFLIFFAMNGILFLECPDVT